jgi:methylmalonyl-CoA mutase
MEDLFSEFDSVNTDQWKAQIQKDLKGLTFEKLCRVDEDSISIEPFYHSDRKKSEGVVSRVKSWVVSQSVDYSDVEANDLALYALNSGAEAIYFENFNGDHSESKFKSVSFDNISAFFSLTNPDDVLKLPNSKSTIVSVFDPLSAFLTGDELNWSQWELYQKNLEQLNSKTLFIKAGAYHELGASPVDEIAYVLSHCCEFLNRIPSNNINEVWLNIHCGENIFHEIAKLRALRKLATLILKKAGFKADIKLMVHTASNMLSKEDYPTNYLRQTFAAFAAVCGGCDFLEIQTLDKSNKNFSRLGRNLQLILREEAFMSKVSDPSSGSYFIESLSEQIAQKALEKFKRIEQCGGLMANREEIIKRISEQKNRKIEQLLKAEKVLVGVNKFPNEKMVYEEADKVFRYADFVSSVKKEKV